MAKIRNPYMRYNTVHMYSSYVQYMYTSMRCTSVQVSQNVLFYLCFITNLYCYFFLSPTSENMKALKLKFMKKFVFSRKISPEHNENNFYNLWGNSYSAYNMIGEFQLHVINFWHVICCAHYSFIESEEESRWHAPLSVWWNPSSHLPSIPPPYPRSPTPP